MISVNWPTKKGPKPTKIADIRIAAPFTGRLVWTDSPEPDATPEGLYVRMPNGNLMAISVAAPFAHINAQDLVGVASFAYQDLEITIKGESTK